MFIIKSIDYSTIDDAIKLILEVFMEFEAPEYSDEGIKTFTDYVMSDETRRILLNRCNVFLGCYHKKQLIGVVAFRNDSHVSLLFVDKNHHRKGIATHLMKKAVKITKKKGVSEITLNSSPYAVPFYHRFGFVNTDTQLLTDGIKYTPMKYIVK